MTPWDVVDDRDGSGGFSAHIKAEKQGAHAPEGKETAHKEAVAHKPTILSHYTTCTHETAGTNGQTVRSSCECVSIGPVRGSDGLLTTSSWRECAARNLGVKFHLKLLEKDFTH